MSEEQADRPSTRDIDAPEILSEIIRYLEKPTLASFITTNRHFFDCGVDNLYQEIPGDLLRPTHQAFRQGPRRARYVEAVRGVVTREPAKDALSIVLSTALLAFPNLQYVRTFTPGLDYPRLSSRRISTIECRLSQPERVTEAETVLYDVSGGPPEEPQSVFELGDERLALTTMLSVHLYSSANLTFVPHAAPATQGQNGPVPRSDWVIPYLSSTRNLNSIEVGHFSPALRMCDLQEICEQREAKGLSPPRFLHSEPTWRYVPDELEGWLRATRGLMKLRMRFFTTPQQHVPAIVDIVRKHCPDLQGLHLAFVTQSKWSNLSKDARAGKPWPMIFRRLVPGAGVSQLSIDFAVPRGPASRKTIARMTSHGSGQIGPFFRHVSESASDPNVASDRHDLYQRITRIIWQISTIARYDLRSARLWVFGDRRAVNIELAVHACQTAMFEIGSMFPDRGAEIDGLPLVDIPGYGNPSVQERARRESIIWDNLQKIRYEVDKLIEAHPPLEIYSLE